VSASVTRLALKKFLGEAVMVEVRASMVVAVSAPPRIDRDVDVDDDGWDSGEKTCVCWL